LLEVDINVEMFGNMLALSHTFEDACKIVGQNCLSNMHAIE